MSALLKTLSLLYLCGFTIFFGFAGLGYVSIFFACALVALTGFLGLMIGFEGDDGTAWGIKTKLTMMPPSLVGLGAGLAGAWWSLGKLIEVINVS